ncbi:hypothetical protein pb186bvf_017136 [Paramecium bursaria]
MLQEQRCKICGNIHPTQPCASKPAKFIWPYPAKTVKLCGSWSQFQIVEDMMNLQDRFECNISLAVGIHQYKFIVNGNWIHDEALPKVPDGLGSFNNQIEVLPKRAYQELETQDGQAKTLIRAHDAEEVIGSWDDWVKPIKLIRQFNYYLDREESIAYLDLKPGRYEFAFKKGNNYFHDPNWPTVPNRFGYFNNVIIVAMNIQIQQSLDYENVYWEKYNLLHPKFDHLYGHTMTSIGNCFYIFGGMLNMVHTNDIYKLTFQEHSLNKVEEPQGVPPTERSFHNAIAYGTKILFFGGLNSKQVLKDQNTFLTSSNAWYYAQNDGQLSARERASMTFYDQEESLIYFGGYYCSHDLEQEIIYNDTFFMNIQTMKWIKLACKNEPEPVYGHSATQINEKMYVFGGTNEHGCRNDMMVLDLVSRVWQKIECKGQAPSARLGHTANLFKSKICIFGGKGERNMRYNDVFLFDFYTFTWTKPQIHGSGPIPRYFHAADVHQDEELWVLGGNIGLKQFIFLINSGKMNIFTL